MSSPFRVSEELIGGALSAPVPQARRRRVFEALLVAARQVIWNWKLRSALRFDARRRFATVETVREALAKYVPVHGGESATVELERLKSLCADYDPVPAYRYLLKQSGNTPEQIVRFVRESILHVDGWPAVMQVDGNERAFSPLETAVSGIGQCTSAASLAAALLETAGYVTRLWAVPGHSFLEWQSQDGRWQLEDVDVFPPDVPLPRGLSMRSLLESYDDWAPILDSLPTMNLIAPSSCFIPTGGGQLHCWHHVLHDPQRYDIQKNFEVGSLPRQLRSLVVRDVVEAGRARLSVENSNPQELLLVVCERAFDVGSTAKIDDIGKQHDVFRFARARGYYDAHFDHAQRKIYARIPGGAKDASVPLAGLDATEISVFTLPPDNPWAEPYLVASRIALKAPTGDMPRPRPVLPPMSEALVEANAVFLAVCQEEADGTLKAAARYAHGSEPERARSAIAENMLQFGGRVLDAGCGTGGFAFALTEHADSIAAIDYTAERVHFLEAVLARLSSRPKIEPAVGSIEDMPYKNGEFDAVYCRGVIFMTDMRRSLTEFRRVLKPGGQVYLDLNADGWNHHLMVDRGKTNADAIRQGRETLYHTAWQRFAGAAIPLLACSVSSNGLRGNVDASADRLDLGALLDEMDRHLSTMTAADAVTVRHLELQARRLCGEAHLPVILADMLAAAAGTRSGPTLSVGSRSWEPEELAKLVRELGYTDFVWWSEAGTRHKPGLRPFEIGPMLERSGTGRDHFRTALSNWHCLFTKSEC